jgi:tRNA (guanine37-N1)-methyltransferase
MSFDIITIFPQIFDSYFSESILKRAQKKGLIKIKIHNLRDFTKDKHKTVDDKSYGGGPGMILKVEPIYRAVKYIKRGKRQSSKKQKIILLTPKGRQFSQKMARHFSKLDRIILICGRYEGVDERVTKFVDAQISVGPYVLTGGEIPAMIIVDTVARLIPGAIKKESLQEETELKIERPTFAGTPKLKIVGEYPQYTRPEVFEYKAKSGKIRKLKVPKVLLSGNHKKIAEWRKKHSK